MLKERFKEVENKILNFRLKVILAAFAEDAENFETFQGRTDFQSICIILGRTYSDTQSLGVLAYMQGGSYSKPKTKKLVTESITTGSGNEKANDDDCPDCPKTSGPERDKVPDISISKSVKVGELKPFADEKTGEVSDEESNEETDEETDEENNLESFNDDIIGEINKEQNPQVSSVEDVIKFFGDKKELAKYGRDVLKLKFSNNISMEKLAEKVFEALNV